MYSLLKGNKLFLYFFEVPLSNILTIEKRQKQMAPKPTNTRAGTKKALSGQMQKAKDGWNMCRLIGTRPVGELKGEK